MNTTTVVQFLSLPWVGTTAGILGIVAAFYFYRMSVRRPRLAFQVDEVTVVGGPAATFPEDVEIRFAGSAVPQVTATRITLWNSGNRTLRGNEIVSADPLRLEISETQVILRAEVVRITRTVNGVDTSPQSKVFHAINIEFDFLDPGDGATIEVFHSDAEGRLACQGTLRGLTKGVTFLGPAYWGKGIFGGFPEIPRIWIYGFILCAGIASLAVGLLLAYFSTLGPSASWFGVIGGLCYILIGGLPLWMRRRRFPIALAM
jgi:hypothetical protein